MLLYLVSSADITLNKAMIIVKLTYEKIEIEIQEINNDDVITTSSPAPTEPTKVRENAYFDFDFFEID